MYFKFKENDIFRNTIITYPKYNCIFTNPGGTGFNLLVNNPLESGTALNIPTDGISVLERNIDRPQGQSIYPFIPKADSDTIMAGYSESDFQSSPYGAILTGSYNINKTVVRDYVTSTQNPIVNSLQNIWTKYRILSSEFSESNFPLPFSYNIFPREMFGSGIKKGSVLAGMIYPSEDGYGDMGYAIAQDIYKDGVLRLTYDSLITSSYVGQIVGYVLYDEGLIMFRSASVKYQVGYNEPQIPQCFAANIEWYSGSSVLDRNWVVFGDLGMVDSAPCYINFQGIQKVNNLVMMCTAPSGKLNTSNNPTFLSVNQNLFQTQSSYSTFVENQNLLIHNNISSSFNIDENFEKETFISEIYIFDEHKNVIGIAKLANPVKKKEINSYTFKISMDI